MNLKHSLSALFVLMSSALHAEVQLSKLFADNMIIQRETQAPVWGWAKPGETISLKTSWGEVASTQADKKGKWLLRIKTPGATTEPQKLSLSDSTQKITRLTTSCRLLREAQIFVGSRADKSLQGELDEGRSPSRMRSIKTSICRVWSIEKNY